MTTIISGRSLKNTDSVSVVKTSSPGVSRGSRASVEGTSGVPPQKVAGSNPANPLQLEAKREITAAWRSTGKMSHEQGLEFGKVCCKWRDMFAETGKRVKGVGVVPILEQLGIPTSTAYWWMDRYKERNKTKKEKHEKEPKEVSLEDVLDKLVTRIVMQPYGYYAAKFSKYSFQHTTELEIVEQAKREVYRLIAEICEAKKA
jgi:hypothetical protein